VATIMARRPARHSGKLRICRQATRAMMVITTKSPTST
jgi:hypothetical protein